MLVKLRDETRGFRFKMMEPLNIMNSNRMSSEPFRSSVVEVKLFNEVHPHVDRPLLADPCPRYRRGAYERRR